MILTRRAFFVGTSKAVALASLVVGTPALVLAARLLPTESPPATPLKPFWPIGALARLDRNEQVVIGERYLRSVPLGYAELKPLMSRYMLPPDMQDITPAVDWSVPDIEAHALRTLIEAAREYEFARAGWRP